ncbi:MAG: selenium cofactor biosynthesis protein YqeC [Actinomycetota bacterium]
MTATIEPVTLDAVAAALGLGDHELVSLVGGGGKTTLLFTLGRQLGRRTVLTTTTKMGRDQTGGYPVLTAPDDDAVAAALDRTGPVLVRRREVDTKARGVAPETCDRWFNEVPGIDHVIVEADGSRQRPFKAPREGEPVIPSRTTTLVACVGAGAIGRVIADACHRPLRLAAVAGCSPYERLTADRLATVLASDRGSRKGCPPAARYLALINQVADHHLPFIDELVANVGSAFPVVAVAKAAGNAAEH